MDPNEDPNLTQRYLAEGLEELAAVRAGGAPPEGRSLEEHIEILEENIAIYRRGLSRRA